MDKTYKISTIVVMSDREPRLLFERPANDGCGQGLLCIAAGSFCADVVQGRGERAIKKQKNKKRCQNKSKR